MSLDSARARAIFEDRLHHLRCRTDRMFAALLCGQWAFGVVVAAWISPRAWDGLASRVHPHVWASLGLGGLIASLPVHLALTSPGKKSTRHVIAAAQMMTSALLIHLMGGRIETHFHVFGSLAFLAFYRDRPVLVTAFAFVLADHSLRGVLWPASVYGVAQVQPWRFLEHAGWVLFEIAFLSDWVKQSLGELRSLAARQAELELANAVVEQRVLERTKELEQALRLAKAAELSIERERLQGQFLANVSHELRTPIAAIKGYAETLRLGALDDAQHRGDFVATIEKNADRLGRLVENLLDVTRLEQRVIAAKPQDVDLEACLRNVLADFAPRLNAKRMSASVDARGVVALADPDHLWQILQNLIANAVKFSPREGRLHLAANAQEGLVIVSVRDEGPGIPAAELDLIFERFHTHGRGVANAGGTGLGLAIARSLVELNGGVIHAESREGSGSTFWFTLPPAGGRSAQAETGLMARAR
jgi:two-component system, sensor histidine kinase and response regulator